MELWVLELTRKPDYECYESEIRGVFDSYKSAENAIDVKGYWTVFRLSTGKAVGNPYYVDELGGEWYITSVTLNTLLKSDFAEYCK